MPSVGTDGKHGHSLDLEKVGPKFSSFNAMPAEITQKNCYNGYCSFTEFVRYLILNSTGAFCVGNNSSAELTLNSNILVA